MIQLNYNKYIQIITTTINNWKKRYLTPVGKITIINFCLLSKLIHLFTSLPTPTDDFIKQIETQFYHCLWDDKPDKIKRIQITQSYNKGGLQMINITNFIKFLKISWFRRLVYNSDNPSIHGSISSKIMLPLSILYHN